MARKRDFARPFSVGAARHAAAPFRCVVERAAAAEACAECVRQAHGSRRPPNQWWLIPEFCHTLMTCNSIFALIFVCTLTRYITFTRHWAATHAWNAGHSCSMYM